MSDIAAALPGTHGHGAHDEHHDPYLKHYFKDKEQQFEAAKLGMWLFLATEILLFGGLFAGFGIMQGRHFEAFRSAHHHLNRTLGAVNTVALLISSFTMVMAVWASSKGRRKEMINYLWATLLLGGVFMFIKLVFEYPEKWQHGLLLGKFFDPTASALPNEFMFFSFYFMMTGLHGFHVLVGMALIGWLIYRGYRGEFGQGYYTPVDLVGLYWHLVDLIWIYLFPLLYLVA